MSYFFPKNVKFISLLRHPITNFESVYNYHGCSQTFQRYENRSSSVTLHEFFEAPMRYLRKALENKDEVAPLLHNGMLFDLGRNFYNETHYNDSLIHQKIRELEKEIDLFLIMEYFDESLVLMKRLFCWTFEDILYIKHNQRHKHRTYSMDAELKRNITNWNRADMLLYLHFNNTLWRKISEEGTPFWNDLKYFRTRLSQLNYECDVRLTKGEAHRRKDTKVIKFMPGENIDSLRTPFCNMVFRTEVDYIQKFRRQYELEIKTKLRKEALLERQRQQQKRSDQRKYISSRRRTRGHRKQRFDRSKF